MWPLAKPPRKLSELSLSSFMRHSKDWFSSKRYLAQWWWVSTRISALEDRNTFPPARRDRRTGRMAEHERKIMKQIHALRNSGNRSSRRRGSIFIPLGLVALLAISPNLQAVIPAPDGGYPGGNTAEGSSALLSLSTGTYNTGLGLFSLRSNTTGNFNTATGAGALLSNTADQNTAHWRRGAFKQYHRHPKHG